MLTPVHAWRKGRETLAITRPLWLSALLERLVYTAAAWNKIIMIEKIVQ